MDRAAHIRKAEVRKPTGQGRDQCAKQNCDDTYKRPVAISASVRGT
jgi:hypothetical protein